MVLVESVWLLQHRGMLLCVMSTTRRSSSTLASYQDAMFACLIKVRWVIARILGHMDCNWAYVHVATKALLDSCHDPDNLYAYWAFSPV